MGIFDKVGKVIDVLTEPETVTKGDDFEKYVVSLFPEDRFSLVEWTTDMCRKHDRFVESDTRPDLTLRHLKTGEVFHVECKFRSDLYQEKLIWTYPEQLERYQKYVKQSGKPFYVVIGLMGKAKKPEYLFCIPLNEAKYPGLYPSVFERFERKKGRPFSYKNGFLK